MGLDSFSMLVSPTGQPPSSAGTGWLWRRPPFELNPRLLPGLLVGDRFKAMLDGGEHREGSGDEQHRT